MRPFITLTATALPLFIDNIDTDQILPGQFLTTVKKEGLGKNLFHAWRQDKNFVLNQPVYANAEILLTGRNFGCGSSREHAPWALLDYGFKAIIGISFADIFKNNSLKNGLLLIELPAKKMVDIIAQIINQPKLTITINLPEEKVYLEKTDYSFFLDPFRKSCLLKGVDDLGYILTFLEKIRSYEKKQKR